MTDGHDSETPGARHLPKQTRSVETRKAILEAAADLFEECGYEQTTTHQIANRAGVSVGALYRYFADKQAVLEELYRHESSSLRDRVLQEFSFAELIGKDLRALARKALGLAFALYGERPGLGRVLSEQARKSPGLSEVRRVQEGAVLEAVRGILTAVPGSRVADPEAAAYLIASFVENLAEDYVFYRSAERRMDEARVIDGAVDLILRYVLED